MRQYKSIIRQAGLPPGSYVTDNGGQEDVRIFLIHFDAQTWEERQAASIRECLPLKETPIVTWINVVGSNNDVMRDIEDVFGVHPLVLEDIRSTGQRSKLEEYDAYTFIVFKMIYHDVKADHVIAEQISLILGPHFVISFEEKAGIDVFDVIRQRIRSYKSRVRKAGPDYLAYTLLDAVVDHYFIILDRIGEQIEEMEEALIERVDPGAAFDIHRLKRDMIFLRKQVWPLREVLHGLQREGSLFIKKSTHVYLRDVYDHTVQVMETIESFRDMLSGLYDIYLTSISNKTNEIMKVLTIFAAIFIPLTFMVGVYGMNFDYMPELRWRHGYFMMLGLMAIVAGGMVRYFKRKNWL
jgi:magnesium transporter